MAIWISTVAPTTVAAEPATAPLPAGRGRLTPPVKTAPAQTYGDGTSGWRWRADRAAVDDVQRELG